MDVREAARFFRAFGDGTRLRILALLLDRRLAVSELVRALGRPQPNISRHLGCLHARGLVESEAVDNSVVYRLAAPAHALQQGAVSLLGAHLKDIEEIPGDRARLHSRSKSRGAR